MPAPPSNPRARALFGGVLQGAYDWGTRRGLTPFGEPTNVGRGPSALWAPESPPYPAEAPPGGGVERQRRARMVGVLVTWIPGPPRPVDRVEARKQSFYLSRSISGVTRDSSGAPLGNCTVKCFATATDTLVFTTTSDASGNFGGTVPTAGAHYLVCYLGGAPDVSGTSRNNLTGS